MILKHYRDAEATDMGDGSGKSAKQLAFVGGAHGVSKRVVIGTKDGATNFIMRVIDFESNAQSPHHRHPWEHEAFVISGRGMAAVGGKEHTIRAGDVFFIPADEDHCFTTADEPMEILCMIPVNDQGVE